MANDINSITLVGRLVRDVEEKALSNGSTHATATLAVNRSVYRGGQWENEASYIDVELFGSSADFIAKYAGKGKMIAVAGYIKQARWEKDGQKFSKIQIIADTVQILGGKDNGGNV